MRIRTILTACAAALLLTGVQPASAGTGASNFCDDGVGWQQVALLTTPITVGLEVSAPPGGNSQRLILCYGVGAEGQPNTGTGGAIVVDVVTTTSTVYPGAFVDLLCYPDYAVGFAPSCAAAASADFALDDASVTTPPNSVCLVSVGSGCAAYVPGVKVSDGNPSRALLQVRVLGTPVDVGVPQCVAVLVACP